MNEERIYVRALEPTDLEFLYKYENSFSVMQWGGQKNLYSRYDFKRFIEDSHQDITITNQKRFIVALKSDDRAIGTVDLYDYCTDNQRVCIGLIFYEESDRNMGYGKEVIRFAKQFCFQQLSIHQLYVEIEADNINSIKMFESCGFKYCGTKKDWIQKSGAFCDIKCYQNILE